MLTQRARRFRLLKRVRTPWQARPELTLVHVEGALGIDIATQREESTEIQKLALNRTERSVPWTWCSIGLNEQKLIRTWIMNMTLNMSTRLAPGRAPTCATGWTPNGRGMSSRLRTSPISEQHLRKNAYPKCKPKLIGYWPNKACQTLFGRFSRRHSLFSRPASPRRSPQRISRCRPSLYMTKRQIRSLMSRRIGPR